MKRRDFLHRTATLAAGAVLFPDVVLQGQRSMLGRSSPTDPWRLSAAELAALVAARRISAREVVDAHNARIQAVNGRVNAVTALLDARALADAQEVDRRLASGSGAGALEGVPFSVKENIDVAGSATTEGVRSLEGNVADVDSPHVALLRGAGAIPIARTNMPDFGLRYHTDNDLHGATRNPWNPRVTPGGSSGGDAVAVATGMVPLGLGNDYGGSLRYPAQCCGVCALRPSRGRIPSATRSTSRGSISNSLRVMAVQGPLARRVEDLRVAMRIMSAYDPRDPNSIAAPADRRLGEPFRVALVTNPAGLGVDDSVRRGVEKAASILEARGGVVEEVDSSNLLESARLWLEMVATDIQELFLTDIQALASEAGRTFVEEMLRLNGEASLARYVRSLARINGIERSWHEIFQKYDAVLGPVSSRNPFAVGFDIEGDDAARALLESQALTVTVNLLGLPAVALPVDVWAGIPQAVQVIGPLFGDNACLDLARMIEEEVGVLTPIDPKRGSE